jgi:hypothetical protein
VSSVRACVLASRLSLSRRRRYYFPPEFNSDYVSPYSSPLACRCRRRWPHPTTDDCMDGRLSQGEPSALCKETAAESEVFTREYSKASVQLDCKAWKGTVTLKDA